MIVNKEALTNARYEKGYTTVDASIKSGIARLTLHRLENGIVKKPNANTLKKLSILYGVDVLNFMKEGD